MHHHLRKETARASILALAAASLASAILPVVVPLAAAAAPGGEIRGAGAPGAVKDRYVITLKDERAAKRMSAVAEQMLQKYGGSLRHRLEIVNGFSARMTAGQAAAIAHDPGVASVAQAYQVEAADTQTSPPNWGDDRVDQRDLPLNSSFTYPANPGQGAHVYVLDTGLNASHVDFSGRVSTGYDFVSLDSTPEDCHGHGTHVAGTAAGTSYGIAKKATVHAVRVLDCAGTGASDDLIAGINWVKNNAVRPAVVNYSIGCRTRCSDPTTDSAVSALIASGVSFVTAAGNSGDDACYYSPQYVAEAVTVGNTDRYDTRNSTSNYGSCLDIFAPGTNIVSASHTSTTGTATMTGTSMASPHVAGAAAVYLAQNPTASPASVRDALVTNASLSKLSSIGTGSPNRLLYTAFMNGTTPPPPPPPGCSGTNATSLTISDNTTVESSITLPSTCGTASASATVSVDITHTYIGDLRVDLVAPDGSVYNLHANSGGAADNIVQTYPVNLSSETAAGTWRLRVNDNAAGDTGRLNTWTLNSGATQTGGSCPAATNGTNYTINDNSTTTSTVSVSCSGTASTSSTVAVDIKHTYRGDVVIDLVAPDGSSYRLKSSSSSDAADNILATYSVNLGSELRSGTWTLRVQDVASGDTGYLDSWTLTL